MISHHTYICRSRLLEALYYAVSERRRLTITFHMFSSASLVLAVYEHDQNWHRKLLHEHHAVDRPTLTDVGHSQ